MEQDQNPSSFERFSKFMRESATIKLIVIGFIILLLLLPLAFVFDVVHERQTRYQEAVNEVGKSWGFRQSITGPFITIPFETKTNSVGTNVVTQDNKAHFLPEKLDIQSNLKTEVRSRGIFDVVVYNTDITMTGTFKQPDQKIFEGSSTINWDKAMVSLGISDLHNLSNLLSISWNDSTINLEPGIDNADFISSGVSAPVTITPTGNGNFNFEIKLSLRGSEGIYFAPFGKETTVNMTGDWASPSFQGAFLPTHETNQNQFNAQWKVTYMNRNYPQQFTSNPQGLEESMFGMNLYVPVTDYQKNERAAKYAVLIIALTFMIFFFVQILNKVRIHGIQFLLVGFALCLFYVLLLSFTEHTGFNLAYLISAAMTISLVGLYVMAIFKNRKLSIANFSFLVLVYGFVFVIIQMQEYALLVGSLGLFIVLAAAMYLSRNITWSENLSSNPELNK